MRETELFAGCYRLKRGRQKSNKICAPWLDVGSSLNTAYITWDDPLTAAPFEMCLYIGCEAAEWAL